MINQSSGFGNNLTPEGAREGGIVSISSLNSGVDNYIIPEGMKLGGIVCISPVNYSVLRWEEVFAGDYVSSEVLESSLRFDASLDDFDKERDFSKFLFDAVANSYTSLKKRGERLGADARSLLEKLTSHFDFSGLSKV